MLANLPLPRPRPDWAIFPAYLALCVVGVIALRSAGSDDTALILRQVIYLLLATALLLAVSGIDLRQAARWSAFFYGIVIALLLAVLLLGEEIRQTTRWIDLGIVRFQPSELAKLTLPLLLCHVIARRGLPVRGANLLWCTVLIALPVALVVVQPDLGTAVLLACAGGIVLFVAGVSWKLIVGGAILLAGFMPAAWVFLMHEYQKRRWQAFFNPELDPLNAGYQIIQSKIAIGAGGLYGKGWLKGTQSQLEFLPERSADFIFSLLCEEFGYTGFLVLFSLYAVIVGKGVLLALRAQRLYTRLLCASISFVLFGGIYLNMGMASGLFPVVGLPLPLIGVGGTSMAVTAIMIGLLLAADREGLSPWVRRA